jgi:hypothetical protein
VGDVCVFKNGYQGIQTYPKAIATHYCTLGSNDPALDCDGFPQGMRAYPSAVLIGSNLGLPVCDAWGGAVNPVLTSGQTCVGTAAVPVRMMGNTAGVNPASKRVFKYGQGLTEASGMCYKVTGPSGNSAVIKANNYCAGKGTCSAMSATSSAGTYSAPCPSVLDSTCPACSRDYTNGTTNLCVVKVGSGVCTPSNPTFRPGCPCVGNTALYPDYPSRKCQGLVPQCDWCASSNHPHFDLDNAAFNWVCNGLAGVCELVAVDLVRCMDPVPQPWRFTSTLAPTSAPV